MVSYAEYRKQWEAAGQGTIVDVPTHIDLELASACNFRCPMCPQAEPIVAFKKDFMPADLAMRLLDEAKSISILSVKLNWRGESTLHPYFCDIASRAYDLEFCDVMLNTNASYAEYKILYSVMDCFDTVIFSVDTLKDDVAEKIRPGKPLSAVLNNIKLTAMNRKITHRPQRLKINFTRQKENWDELSDMEEFCKKHDIELVTRPVFPRNPPKVGQYFDESKIKVLGRKNCGYPFQRLTIAWDGKAFMCCVPWLDEGYVGNVCEQSLLDIWNGKEINDIRKQALAAQYTNKVCKECTSWQSYEIKVLN